MSFLSFVSSWYSYLTNSQTDQESINRGTNSAQEEKVDSIASPVLSTTSQKGTSSPPLSGRSLVVDSEQASQFRKRLENGESFDLVIQEAEKIGDRLCSAILEKVTKLSINGELSLHYLMEYQSLLKGLTSLSITNCSNLESLSRLSIPADCILKIAFCKDLQSLPLILGLERLEIQGCFSLKQIPIMPNLRSLSIDCSYITKLPPIPNLEYFEIKGCTRLEKDGFPDEILPLLNPKEWEEYTPGSYLRGNSLIEYHPAQLSDEALKQIFQFAERLNKGESLSKIIAEANEAVDSEHLWMIFSEVTSITIRDEIEVIYAVLYSQFMIKLANIEASDNAANYLSQLVNRPEPTGGEN